MANSLDPHMLDLLVCPLTKENLRYDGANERLISEKASLAYPVRDGIPILLIDEAEPWSPEPEIPAAVRADPPEGEGGG